MVDYICSAAFVAYGMVVGARFAFYSTASAHKQSCKMYSVSGAKCLRNLPAHICF